MSWGDTLVAFSPKSTKSKYALRREGNAPSTENKSFEELVRIHSMVATVPYPDTSDQIRISSYGQTQLLGKEVDNDDSADNVPNLLHAKYEAAPRRIEECGIPFKSPKGGITNCFLLHFAQTTWTLPSDNQSLLVRARPT